jgi:hypothetical protein
MAVHASFGGRNSGKARILYRRVAVPAIQPETGGVVLMAEWDWLFRSDMLPGYIRRALKLQDCGAYRR